MAGISSFAGIGVACHSAQNAAIKASSASDRAPRATAPMAPFNAALLFTLGGAGIRLPGNALALIDPRAIFECLGPSFASLKAALLLLAAEG